MTVLSARQVAAEWDAAGGNRTRVVAWVAVSYAESGFRTDVVSPTGAVGLWQIEPYSWPAGAGPFSNAVNPGPNAYAAVILSGGGMNFAPWDTAYANIGRSGRYSFLAWPEGGSAAANNMSWIAGQLGNGFGGGTTRPSAPGTGGTLPGALPWYAQATSQAIPGLIRDARKIGVRANAFYTPRWR